MFGGFSNDSKSVSSYDLNKKVFENFKPIVKEKKQLELSIIMEKELEEHISIMDRKTHFYINMEPPEINLELLLNPPPETPEITLEHAMKLTNDMSLDPNTSKFILEHALPGNNNFEDDLIKTNALDYEKSADMYFPTFKQVDGDIKAMKPHFTFNHKYKMWKYSPEMGDDVEHYQEGFERFYRNIDPVLKSRFTKAQIMTDINPNQHIEKLLRLERPSDFCIFDEGEEFFDKLDWMYVERNIGNNSLSTKGKGDLHLKAIVIQSFIRGYISRKYVLDLRKGKVPQKRGKRTLVDSEVGDNIFFTVSADQEKKVTFKENLKKTAHFALQQSKFSQNKERLGESSEILFPGKYEDEGVNKFKLMMKLNQISKLKLLKVRKEDLDNFKQENEILNKISHAAKSVSKQGLMGDYRKRPFDVAKLDKFQHNFIEKVVNKNIHKIEPESLINKTSSRMIDILFKKVENQNQLSLFDKLDWSVPKEPIPKKKSKRKLSTSRMDLSVDTLKYSFEGSKSQSIFEDFQSHSKDINDSESGSIPLEVESFDDSFSKSGVEFGDLYSASRRMKLSKGAKNKKISKFKKRRLSVKRDKSEPLLISQKTLVKSKEKEASKSKGNEESAKQIEAEDKEVEDIQEKIRNAFEEVMLVEEKERKSATADSILQELELIKSTIMRNQDMLRDIEDTVPDRTKIAHSKLRFIQQNEHHGKRSQLLLGKVDKFIKNEIYDRKLDKILVKADEPIPVIIENAAGKNVFTNEEYEEKRQRRRREMKGDFDYFEERLRIKFRALVEEIRTNYKDIVTPIVIKEDGNGDGGKEYVIPDEVLDFQYLTEDFVRGGKIINGMKTEQRKLKDYELYELRQEQLKKQEKVKEILKLHQKQDRARKRFMRDITEVKMEKERIKHYDREIEEKLELLKKIKLESSSRNYKLIRAKQALARSGKKKPDIKTIKKNQGKLPISDYSESKESFIDVSWIGESSLE